MSIYVGNLSYEVTQDDLIMVFAEYGTIKRIRLTTNQEIGHLSRSFAFVDMRADAEETIAIEALNGAEWMGRDLKVNKSRSCES
ncbi:MAG: RNA recognition motif domain-containing protein [Leptolyngbyaceae cyanobacterium]